MTFTPLSSSSADVLARSFVCHLLTSSTYLERSSAQRACAARRRAAQQAWKFYPKDVRCHEGYLYCLCSRPGEAIVTVPVDDRHAHRKHVCYSRAFHEFIHGSIPHGESERGEQRRDRIREQFKHTTTVVVPFGVGKSPLCCLCCLR